MVPARFVALDELPLTPQGKIDRAALTAADPTPSTDRVAARNDLERDPVGIWQVVLGVDGIGIHDNFFEHGGHSLQAIRAGGEHPRRNSGRPCGCAPSSERPTIAGIAAPPRRARSPPIDRAHSRARRPTRSPSSAPLVAAGPMAGAPAYNMSGAHVLEGPLDVGALDRALSALVVGTSRCERRSSRLTASRASRSSRRPAVAAGTVNVSAASDPERATSRDVLRAAVSRRCDSRARTLLR